MSDYQAPPPPPPPPPGYGAPGPMGYDAPPKTDGMATASLVLGILSFVCLGFIGGVLAIVFGVMSKKRIAQSNGSLKGAGMAQAGMILGIIGLIVSVIGLIWYVSSI